MSAPLRPDQVGEYHEHRCGFTRGIRAKGEGKDGEGCGHVWGHGAENYGLTDPHVCPACGKGPWYTHWEGSDELKDSKEVESFNRLLDLIEALDGLRTR